MHKNEGKQSSGFVSSTKLKCHYVSLFLAETAAGISQISGFVQGSGIWFHKSSQFHIISKRE